MYEGLKSDTSGIYSSVGVLVGSVGPLPVKVRTVAWPSIDFSFATSHKTVDFFPQSKVRCPISELDERIGGGSCWCLVWNDSRVLWFLDKAFIKTAGLEKGSIRTLKGFTTMLRFFNNNISQGLIGLSVLCGSTVGHLSVECYHKRMFILFSFFTLKTFLVSVVQFIASFKHLVYFYI